MDLSAYVSFFEIYNGKVRKNNCPPTFMVIFIENIRLKYQVIQVILKVKHVTYTF